MTGKCEKQLMQYSERSNMTGTHAGNCSCRMDRLIGWFTELQGPNILIS